MARRQTLGKKRKTRNMKRRRTVRKMRRMRGGGREELETKLEKAQQDYDVANDNLIKAKQNLVDYDNSEIPYKQEDWNNSHGLIGPY